MNYYIFDTEAEASIAQTADYNDYISSLPDEKEVDGGEGGTIIIPIDNTVYITGTTSWDAPPKQRETDSKWTYRESPSSTSTGRTIEARDTGGTWFTVSEP